MGAWAGARGVAAWDFQPNLFGHGHYATYDAVLSSLWVLAILCFAGACRCPSPARQHETVGLWRGFGLVLGCALATKLTGWFLPLPFLAWAAWTRDRRAIRVLIDRHAAGLCRSASPQSSLVDRAGHGRCGSSCRT